MLTREIIRQGIEKGIITFEEDFGIRCRIGDYNFYFPEKSDFTTVEEFYECYTEKEIIDIIYDVLKTEKDAEDNGIYEDEYGYYVAYLLEII